jgi:hypothetical protein
MRCAGTFYIENDGGREAEADVDIAGAHPWLWDRLTAGA